MALTITWRPLKGSARAPPITRDFRPVPPLVNTISAGVALRSAAT